MNESTGRNEGGAAFGGAVPGTEPGPALRPRRERTRARILEAAGELFNRDGFEETSMHFIAAATRMGVGTLYGYFPSKDAILREVLIARTAARIGAYRDAIAGEVHGLERILLGFDFLTTYIDENRPILRAILRTDGADEAARTQTLEWVFQGFRALLASAQAQGHARPGPIDTLARTIIGAALSAGLGQGPWRGVESDLTVRAELRQVVRELLEPRA